VNSDRKVQEFHRKMHPASVLNTEAAGYSETSLPVHSAARSPEFRHFKIALKAQVIYLMVKWY